MIISRRLNPFVSAVQKVVRFHKIPASEDAISELALNFRMDVLAGLRASGAAKHYPEWTDQIDCIAAPRPGIETNAYRASHKFAMECLYASLKRQFLRKHCADRRDL